MQARSVHVGQIEEVFHHLRTVQSLVADLLDRGKVDLFARLRGECGGDKKEEAERKESFHKAAHINGTYRRRPCAHSQDHGGTTAHVVRKSRA